MKLLTIKNPSENQLVEIERFVVAHPQNTYFQSRLFFEACRNSPGLVPCFWTACDEEGQLLGVMLAFRQVQYRLFPFSFLSSRLIVWGGPLIVNDNPDVLKKIFVSYESSRPRVIYTQIRNLTEQSLYRDIMAGLGFEYEDHLDIIVDLRKTEEQLWQEVHSKRRNEIRRAMAGGVSFVNQDDRQTLLRCYEILQEVYQRARLPLPKIDHFEALLDGSSNHGGLKLFVAQLDGKVIGCMLCLAYGDTLFDYYAGAYSAFYSRYPNDLIPWEVFKWGKLNGYARFVFGGAGKPGVPYGVRDYKKKFGGELVNYGRYEKIHYPFFYKLALKGLEAWKSLPK
jgi:serine/alanine adding enzyme